MKSVLAASVLMGLSASAACAAAPRSAAAPPAITAAPTTTTAPVATRPDAAGNNADGNVQHLNNAEADEQQATPFHENPDASPEGGTGGVPAGAAPPR